MGDFKMDKVFYSNITRNDHPSNNGLYDLLCITPATPIETQNDKSDTMLCSFRPNTDKYYIPKKKSKLKVNTVRDIRNTFEKDVYTHLSEELEKQLNMLLKKIKGGSSADEQFKNTSNNILNAENPISRTAWQMLINLNPNNYKHSKQYVLWNGQSIHVNGSKGGRTKFICNYDLVSSGIVQHYRLNLKKKIKKIGLLKNSLFVKFKPGPLCTKKYLDESYQKYNLGEIEVIPLPKPSLDVQPTYGIPLDVNLTQFLNNWRDGSGKISEKWAEFATSVVGTVNKSNAVQKDPYCEINFGLNYKYNQNRILMRRDADRLFNNNNYTPNSDVEIFLPTEDTVFSEVKQIVTKMLDSVELSLLQDTMFNEFDEPRENNCKDSDAINLTHKEKSKRKYKELNRLDVTVIQLPDNCQNSFCDLGCICESLKYCHNPKRHCGLLECIFGCKCDFYKYNHIEILENEPSGILPGLVNLDKERHLKLAREEQKFHQTVIVTGEKRILLKPDKRNIKALTKCAKVCNSVSNRKNTIIDKELLVVTRKLNLKNVEPWCMVHNLYKCFCKNRFIVKYNEADISNINNTVNESNNVNGIDKQCNDDCTDNTAKIMTREDKRKSIEKIVLPTIFVDDSDCTSARVNAFYSRKYSEDYYKVTNKRIIEMEKNDLKLQEKLISKINKIKCTSNSELEVMNDLTPDSQVKGDELNLQSEHQNLNKPKDPKESPITSGMAKCRNPSAYSKLVKWIESSYKHYKKQFKQGLVEKSLQPPKQRKLALHSWEFILNRYKEKKNHFLVTKEKPHRIFMAVNHKHPAFENCINIDYIRFADINTYPHTVKKLLTNSKDFKENFCIMRGLPYCWEIVGSVTKKSEDSEDSSKTEDDFDFSESSRSEFNDSTLFDIDSSSPISFERISTSIDIDSSSIDSFTEKISNEKDNSRWFVMRIENDFSELQFHTKGFFVKYENILEAINVARKSDKTVRISRQKCIDKSSGLQFGIYATPNANENCVIVGPYETDEPLGIETVKTFLDFRKQKRTRGVWITTNKIDNINVINNPMSYMPLSDKGFEEIISICNDSLVNAKNTAVNNPTEFGVTDKDGEESKKETHEKQTTTSPSIPHKVVKIVKPIKIRKVDAVYRVTSSNFLRTSSDTVSKSYKIKSNRIQLISNSKQCLNRSDASFKKLKLNVQPIKVLSGKSPVIKPVAQIAPQVNNDLQQILRDRDKTNVGIKSGLIILKPEEVIKILEEKKIGKAGSSKENDNFNEKLNSPKDVFVISDDDEKEDADMAIEWRHVKISCSTVNWTACLPGRKNKQNLLSFTFPGSKPSIFYKEEEALSEINRLFHSKVDVPADVGLMWQVIETDDHFEEDHYVLTPEYLNNDFVLTSTGLQHKDTLITQSEEMDQIQLSNFLQEEISIDMSQANFSEPSVQDAIVLEDGSLFVMDDANKNTINEKLIGSTDEEKLQMINLLEFLKSQNT